jgi:hypothetical protein
MAETNTSTSISTTGIDLNGGTSGLSPHTPLRIHQEGKRSVNQTSPRVNEGSSSNDKLLPNKFKALDLIRAIPKLQAENYGEWKWRIGAVFHTVKIPDSYLNEAPTDVDQIQLTGINLNKDQSVQNAPDFKVQNVIQIPPDIKELAYHAVVSTVGSEYTHILEQYSYGDLQGVWRGLMDHFQQNTKRVRSQKMILFFGLVMEKDGNFEVFYGKIRREAKILNAMTNDRNLMINESQEMSVLTNGILTNNFDNYNTICTLIDHTPGIDMPTARKLILPIYLRNPNSGKEAANAASNTGWRTTRREFNGPKGECYFFKKHGHCKFGDRCRYKHVAGTGNSSSNEEKKNNPKSTELRCTYCKYTGHHRNDCARRKMYEREEANAVRNFKKKFKKKQKKKAEQARLAEQTPSDNNAPQNTTNENFGSDSESSDERAEVCFQAISKDSVSSCFENCSVVLCLGVLLLLCVFTQQYAYTRLDGILLYLYSYITVITHSIFNIRSFEKAFVASRNSEMKKEWIVDSGATSHMCKYPELFSNLTPCNIMVTVANSHTVHVKQRGSVVIHTHKGRKLILENVLLIPELEHNILSIGKLDAQDFTQIIRKGKCVIKKGKIKIVAKKDKGLYIFVSTTCEKVNFAGENLDVWHQRFGTQMHSTCASC